MKKILLLSDTHSYIGDDILKHVKKADEVWHAGDIGDLKVTDAIKKVKPLRAVYGNIDSHEVRAEFPENKIKELTKATIRCIPIDKSIEEGMCVYSGNPSKQRVLFAKAY